MLSIYYRSAYLARYRDQLPGIDRFLAFFKVYGQNFSLPIDRSGVIKFPVKTKSLFPIPAMRPFAKPYVDICNDRAQAILKRAEKADASLYAFWSGGIDSTLMLVSLIKNAMPAQLERVVVLLDEASIDEYPAFYRDHIRGKLKRESSTLFPYLLGGKNIIVTGEHNDQLMGSDVVAKLISKFGAEVVHAPCNRKLLIAFFAEKMGEANAAFYADLFEKLTAAAPIPIKTNAELFWWINFALKWQSVYMRVLSYAASNDLTRDYLKSCYVVFYNTEEFQLWSMNNLDKKIKATWKTYKWPAKDIIYEFTNDADYRDNKIKRGSLQFLVAEHPQFNFIDDKLRLHEEATPEQFYAEENDFL